MKKLTLLSVGAVLALTACSPRGDGSYTRSSLGTVTGALVGGVVGNQFGGGSGRELLTIGGALYGAGVGNDWGRSIDRYQLQGRTRSSDGVFEYLPDDTYKAWVNPNTGKTTTIRPIQTMPQEGSNANCRLFETTRSGGYSAIGMVCRDSYGRWRLME